MIPHPLQKVLVSACLLGQRVRYDGTDARKSWPDLGALERWQTEGRVVALCPELARGFSVPRPPAEIVGGTAAEVLDGEAEVAELGGNLVTASFIRGAQQALSLVQGLGVRGAVLKEGSPSCGVLRIYDGEFSGQTQGGRGVTAELLQRHGVQGFSEAQVADAEAWLTRLEG
ncbi:DUF523 domain-containing protein [Deinococcus arenicola]|uniref:DUF523 domain-containing protein n=1 Tax=Deinococcus arenicola TaxID=2994950 RepID=A0ABU4DNE9_9DEIO|nr:DUF523 domain-containing protein [Deinococcus sp. ZS9-10]MDV6373962.1 DUF523 domain-containing protein [Deinococcus sp. ZS9-10]